MERVSGDFGEELRRRRIAAGLSLRDLSALVHYSRGHLSKVETGQMRASADLARLSDAALAADGELTALVGSRHHDSPPPVQTGSPAMSDLLMASARFNHVRADQAELALGTFRGLFGQLRHLGQRMSAAVLLPTLVAQAHTLRDLAGAAPERVQPQVLALAARYAEYIGWMAQEVGADEAALWWTAEAVRFATAAGDPVMSSYALVRRALVSLYRGDARQMVGLSQLAQEHPGASTRVRGLAALREAQGHALSGDGYRSYRALDRAREELARAGSDPDPLVLGITTVVDLAAMGTGWCLHDLGHSEQAAAVLDREVARIPEEASRSWARFSVRRALAYAAAGDVDRACALAAELLPVVTDVASATVCVDLRRLNRTLLRWPSHAAVRELQPLLNTATHARLLPCHGGPMHKIFINFRTGDQDVMAPVIKDWLDRQFGDRFAFYSSTSIPAGNEFPEALLAEASQCEVLLALIGPSWLTLAGADGIPRLRQPDDWVRKEIATALAAGRRVVPVLIGDVRRLAEDQLPGDIAALGRLESVRIRRTDLENDLIRLRDELMTLIPGLTVRTAHPASSQVVVEVGEVTETGSVTGVRTRSGGDPGISAHVRVQHTAGPVTGVDHGPDPADLEAPDIRCGSLKSWIRRGLPATVSVLLGGARRSLSTSRPWAGYGKHPARRMRLGCHLDGVEASRAARGGRPYLS